jgi:hypothetical protein
MFDRYPVYYFKIVAVSISSRDRPIMTAFAPLRVMPKPLSGAGRRFSMTKTMLFGSFVASALVLAATGGSAFAQSGGVPVLNVRPVCRGIAQQAGTPGEVGGPSLGYRQCIRSEMAMRRKLVRRWSRYTPDEKANCIGDEMGGEGSYTDLATCLQMARAARKLNN